MFTGEYRHSVDEKGRIAVPVKFRAPLAGGAVVSRWPDGCLAIHTQDGWEALDAKLAALPLADANARRLNRHLFGGAHEDVPDKQGRVSIPAFLREHAGLEGEAVVVGARDHVEVWAPDRWEAYRRELEDPEAFARAIENLGI